MRAVSLSGAYEKVSTRTSTICEPRVAPVLPIEQHKGARVALELKGLLWPISRWREQKKSSDATRISLNLHFSSRSTSLWEAKLGVPSWPCRACPRWRPWGAAYRWACHAALGPTSVVVLPIGTPMRCLREDMAVDSVLEGWVMVPRGLPHHHHRRVEGSGGVQSRIF